MLNYAQVRQESYYAKNYAGIMCQGLCRVCGVSSYGNLHQVRSGICPFCLVTKGFCVFYCLPWIQLTQWPVNTDFLLHPCLNVNFFLPIFILNTYNSLSTQFIVSLALNANFLHQNGCKKNGKQAPCKFSTLLICG